jgi:hypothetical protein
MRFPEIVTANFSFLVSKFGFKSAVVSEGEVRFDSSNVIVLLIYDFLRSYEVDFSVQLKMNASQPFHSLGELLRFRGIDNSKKYECFASQDLKAVENYLQNVACIVEKEFGELLMGNVDQFSQLDAFRSKEAQEYTNEHRDKVLRSRAAIEWDRKDFSAFIKTMNSIDAELTETEKKKIEIAKKNLIKG